MEKLHEQFMLQNEQGRGKNIVSYYILFGLTIAFAITYSILLTIVYNLIGDISVDENALDEIYDLQEARKYYNISYIMSWITVSFLLVFLLFGSFFYINFKHFTPSNLSHYYTDSNHMFLFFAIWILVSIMLLIIIILTCYANTFLNIYNEHDVKLLKSILFGSMIIGIVAFITSIASTLLYFVFQRKVNKFWGKRVPSKDKYDFNTKEEEEEEKLTFRLSDLLPSE